MTIAFKATEVCCDEALDGDILEVTFDTVPASCDEEDRTSPYVLIGQNFEFPGPAMIEWHDGKNYDGGATIISLTLTKGRALIRLDRGLEIDVAFRVPPRKLARLKSFLKRILDDRVIIEQ